MREHFEECGNVEAVRLVRDRGSGMGKGFGYVLFEVKLTVSYLMDTFKAFILSSPSKTLL